MIGRYGTAERFTGQVWGNGEFGLTIQKSFTVPLQLQSRGAESRERSLYRPILPDLRETVHGGKEGSYERADVCVEIRQRTPSKISKEVFEYLGLSPHANSHNRSKRGSKGISKYGARLVRNACYELEKRYGKDRISFLTLTIPPMSNQNLMSLIESWGEVVRKFHQWLRRQLIGKGLPPHIVGVTEIQTKRYLQSGFLGYHLHMAFVGRQKGRQWVLTPRDFSAAWKRLVEAHLAHPEHSLCWSASARVERVLYSLESYLGKYLTKGSKEVANVALIHGEEFLVSSWHTISRELKELVLRERYRGNGEVMKFLCELCEVHQEDVFLWLKKVHIVIEGVQIPWGWTGKLTKFGQECLKAYRSAH